MRLILSSSIVLAAVIARPSGPIGAQHAVATGLLAGVYTEEQAGRGEALYGTYCISCHGQDLNGGDTAPALVGGDFIRNWKTLGQLFGYMKTSMPLDSPDSLTERQTVDILAFILKKSDFPAGQSALTPQIEVLNTIIFVGTQP